jgi:hypothetical protein
MAGGLTRHAATSVYRDVIVATCVTPITCEEEVKP